MLYSIHFFDTRSTVSNSELNCDFSCLLSAILLERTFPTDNFLPVSLFFLGSTHVHKAYAPFFSNRLLTVVFLNVIFSTRCGALRPFFPVSNFSCTHTGPGGGGMRISTGETTTTHTGEHAKNPPVLDDAAAASNWRKQTSRIVPLCSFSLASRLRAAKGG